jgi:hypothetical protein
MRIVDIEICGSKIHDRFQMVSDPGAWGSRAALGSPDLEKPEVYHQRNHPNQTIYI